MLKVKTKKRFIPSYENGTAFSDISKFLRSQMAAYEPTKVPKGFGASSYGLQGGALASQIFALMGQKTKEEPFIANPTDVNAAYKKNNVSNNISLLDNFFLGQQQSLVRSLGASGSSAYDIGNIVSKPMGQAANVRSEQALSLVGQNNELDRQRAGFNIRQGEGITAAENMTVNNENQKLSLLGGKVAEGAGAFSNLSNSLYMNKQNVDLINNSKMAQMMNQILTAGFYDQLYKKK